LFIPCRTPRTKVPGRKHDRCSYTKRKTRPQDITLWKIIETFEELFRMAAGAMEIPKYVEFATKSSKILIKFNADGKYSISYINSFS
jgi:hypothetical protein